MRMRARRSNIKEIVVMGALAVGAAAALWKNSVQETTQVCTLSDKAGERIPASDGTSKYLIFTKDCGEFENSDAWLKLKFDSSSAQNAAYNNAGKKVTITSTGNRVPFFSMYPNVISLDPVPQPPPKPAAPAAGSPSTPGLS